MEGSPKIKRWKLALQEYDFSIEHIAGDKNVIADYVIIIKKDEKGGGGATLMLSVLKPDNIRINQREYDNISRMHNSTVGHAGVKKTLDRLMKGNFNWNRMRKHVRKFILE